MIEFDENKLPSVQLENSWQLANGDVNSIYRAGSWSFETEDLDEKAAEEAIYAWIAWYNFIKNQDQ